jgi:hypothetical protein
MSRSHRKPFQAITGASSAKRDKQLAARAFRRLANQLVRLSEDPVIPHRRQASHNNVWSWARDGRQHYQSRYISWGKDKGQLDPDWDGDITRK